MGMGARTATPTEKSILTLSQWISPSYPVGSLHIVKVLRPSWI